MTEMRFHGSCQIPPMICSSWLTVGSAFLERTFFSQKVFISPLCIGPAHILAKIYLVFHFRSESTSRTVIRSFVGAIEQKESNRLFCRSMQSIDRLIDRSMDWLIGRSIDRLIDWSIDGLNNWLIDWLIDWLFIPSPWLIRFHSILNMTPGGIFQLNNSLTPTKAQFSHQLTSFCRF